MRNPLEEMLSLATDILRVAGTINNDVTEMPPQGVRLQLMNQDVHIDMDIEAGKIISINIKKSEELANVS